MILGVLNAEAEAEAEEEEEEEEEEEDEDDEDDEADGVPPRLEETCTAKHPSKNISAVSMLASCGVFTSPCPSPWPRSANALAAARSDRSICEN